MYFIPHWFRLIRHNNGKAEKSQMSTKEMTVVEILYTLANNGIFKQQLTLWRSTRTRTRHGNRENLEISNKSIEKELQSHPCIQKKEKKLLNWWPKIHWTECNTNTAHSSSRKEYFYEWNTRMFRCSCLSFGNRMPRNVIFTCDSTTKDVSNCSGHPVDRFFLSFSVSL